jgi:hypothetical protein
MLSVSYDLTLMNCVGIDWKVVLPEEDLRQESIQVIREMRFLAFERVLWRKVDEADGAPEYQMAELCWAMVLDVQKL